MRKIDVANVLSLVSTVLAAVGMLMTSKVDKLNRDKMKAEIMDEIKKDLK